MRLPLSWLLEYAAIGLSAADAAGVQEMSRRLTGWRRTLTSTRSSSGPEILARSRRRAAGEQEQPDLPGPAAFAHGPGFAASTRVNRAGKTACVPARAIPTSPDSSGWRSASSTSR